MKLKIYSLRIEKYVGESVSGHNCNFDYEPAIKDRYVLNCKDVNHGQSYEIKLWESEGECGSGWCSASWGSMTCEQVSTFKGFTHRPVDLATEPFDFEFSAEEGNYPVFCCNVDGGDSYYPSGNIFVNMEYFIPSERCTYKRPVWIFEGASVTGKSFLSSLLSLNVYETDTNPTLPKVLTEDVIVLGNKYPFAIQDIKSRIFGEHDLNIVSFSKGN